MKLSQLGTAFSFVRYAYHISIGCNPERACQWESLAKSKGVFRKGSRYLSGL